VNAAVLTALTVHPSFQPGAALAGGGLLGVGLVLALLASGRVVGVSGVLGGLLPSRAGDRGWRLAFLFGLLAGGAALALWWPQAVAFPLDRSWVALVAAGLLVGYGTRLANGCTSGHGVCGVSRLSPRSLLATATFVGSGALTVFVIDTVFGGRL
jgi:uncharacterized membrane protein YedE/YeeE